MKTGPVQRGVSLLSDSDVHLFREGRHFRLYEKLGSHPMEVDGVGGTLFATWAPSAKGVSVVGDFNGWDPDSHSLEARWDGSGIWEGFLPGVGKGSLYKYHIISHHQSDPVTRGDPFAFHWEIPPETASIVWPLDYRWRDRRWMDGRDRSNSRGYLASAGLYSNEGTPCSAAANNSASGMVFHSRYDRREAIS